MRSRKLAITAMGVIAALALAGCSSAAGTGGSGGKVTLNLVQSLTDPNRTPVIQQNIAAFEKANPNITVNLISPPTDSGDQKIQTMLQSKSGIDVLEVRDLTVGSFSANGWLYDMSGDLKSWSGWSDQSADAKTAGNVGNKTYYLPYGFYLASLFYRKDLTKEVTGSSTAPLSWPQVLAAGEKIQNAAKGQYGYSFRGARHADVDLSMMIQSYVGKDLNVKNAFMQKDGSTIFSSQAAKDAVANYLNLFKKASPPSAIAWNYPEQVQGFSAGTTAYMVQTQEVIATLGQSTSINKSQWATAPLPTGPGGIAAQQVGSAGWGVAASSQHKAEAVKLVEFLGSGSAALAFAKQQSLVPNTTSGLADPFYKTAQWAAFNAMSAKPSTYVNVEWPETVSWWSAWQQKADVDVQNLLTGKLSADAMLSDWDQYWTAHKSVK